MQGKAKIIPISGSLGELEGSVEEAPSWGELAPVIELRPEQQLEDDPNNICELHQDRRRMIGNNPYLTDAFFIEICCCSACDESKQTAWGAPGEEDIVGMAQLLVAIGRADPMEYLRQITYLKRAMRARDTEDTEMMVELVSSQLRAYRPEKQPYWTSDDFGRVLTALDQ